jgi:quercetin dioxygenase-like cupin family protein
LIEAIQDADTVLAYLVRGRQRPDRTTFLTPDEANLQVGYVVYPAGGEIARHVHQPIERHVVGTNEVLVVQEGRCEVDIYDDRRHLITTRELQVGDILIAVRGGHGFRVLEDTVLLEIKQGPFMGDATKERF